MAEEKQSSGFPIQKEEARLIYTVDDEPDILELVNINLGKIGFKTKGFEDAQSFFDALNKTVPDLIILDLMLPDADGMEVCKFLKNDAKLSNVPVIMLTAKSEEMDKVLGLELGADDYIVKPFSVRELTARVKAVLRRGEPSDAPDRIKVGENLVIDLQKYETYVEDKKIDLTTTEFKILKLLSNRKGWVYSREQILDYLGGGDKGVLDRTVDVHIKNLREKLGSAGVYIKNIRGVGYKLDVQ